MPHSKSSCQKTTYRRYRKGAFFFLFPPIPFAYDSGSGRFNAIGGTDLNSIIFTFNTSGDVQLFEEASLVPALSAPTAIALVLAMLTAGTIRIRQRASPM